MHTLTSLGGTKGTRELANSRTRRWRHGIRVCTPCTQKVIGKSGVRNSSRGVTDLPSATRVYLARWVRRNVPLSHTHTSTALAVVLTATALVLAFCVLVLAVTQPFSVRWVRRNVPLSHTHTSTAYANTIARAHTHTHTHFMSSQRNAQLKTLSNKTNALTAPLGYSYLSFYPLLPCNAPYPLDSVSEDPTSCSW